MSTNLAPAGFDDRFEGNNASGLGTDFDIKYEGIYNRGRAGLYTLAGQGSCWQLCLLY